MIQVNDSGKQLAKQNKAYLIMESTAAAFAVSHTVCQLRQCHNLKSVQ